MRPLPTQGIGRAPRSGRAQKMAQRMAYGRAGWSWPGARLHHFLPTLDRDHRGHAVAQRSGWKWPRGP